MMEKERLRFTKMEGLGNDYVYMDCMEKEPENPSALAVAVSDRHFGVGADGLILICPSKKADFQMKMYNADGSRGEMCGNGIRCVGKYVYDKGLTDKTSLVIETLAGLRRLELTLSGHGTREHQEDQATALPRPEVEQVTVDMGSPILEASKIPVSMELIGDDAIDVPIRVGRQLYHMTCVSMGNPHAVVYLDAQQELDDFPLGEIGPMFEHHPYFPQRVNTEFVKVIDRNTLAMRVWERGSGETLACGTGACAVAVSSVINGFTSDDVTVRLQGGDLHIRWDRQENKVYMTGSARIVFEGEW